jgi:hypothetical protein
VPDLEAKIAQLSFNNRNTEDMLESSRESAASWKRKAESIAMYIAYLGEGVGKHANGVFAFDARWVAVASLWPFDVPDPSPMNRDGSPRKSFIEAVVKVAGKEAIAREILTAWECAEAEVGTPGQLETKRLPMGLSILKLDCGAPTLVLGHRWAALGGRVIGSLPPDKLPMERTRLTHSTAQTIVFEALNPYLVPDGLLVSLNTNKRNRVAWSLTCPEMRFSTKKYILAVG